MIEIVWYHKGMEFVEVVESTFRGLEQWQTTQDRSFDNFHGLMTQEDDM